VIAAILKASKLDETKKSVPIPPESSQPQDVQARQKMMNLAKGGTDPWVGTNTEGPHPEKQEGFNRKADR